jgi:hypothetical protein
MRRTWISAVAAAAISVVSVGCALAQEKQVSQDQAPAAQKMQKDQDPPPGTENMDKRAERMQSPPP